MGLADFAKGEAMLRAAKCGIFGACTRAWERAERGERASKDLQAEIAMSVSYGTEVAVEVASTMHRLGGSAATYADSDLLRRLRDVETARQHILFGHSHRPVFAKALTGQDMATRRSSSEGCSAMVVECSSVHRETMLTPAVPGAP